LSFGGIYYIIPADEEDGTVTKDEKQTDGQMCFRMCIDRTNYVVQSNDLVGGKQALKLNSAKLIRAAIMQVVHEDSELKPYIISVKDLAGLLGVSESNLYRDIKSIRDDIKEHPVFIKVSDGNKVHWRDIPWYSYMEYKSGAGFAIKLNSELKPYLLNLKSHYTQYTLDNILAMKSVYAIRIFELIQKENMLGYLPKEGTDILLSVMVIRECCDCVSKYERFSQFRAKVLDMAVREIERVTLYTLEYECLKKGKSIETIKFHVNMSYHKVSPEKPGKGP